MDAMDRLITQSKSGVFSGPTFNNEDRISMFATAKGQGIGRFIRTVQTTHLPALSDRYNNITSKCRSRSFGPLPRRLEVYM